MRNQKTVRTPVRSPSPDIAHRNIIAKTQSPLEQALSKSRFKQSSRINSGLSFAESEDLQNRLQVLDDKYRLLLKQNYTLNEKLSHIQVENNQLKGDLLRLSKHSYHHNLTPIATQDAAPQDYASRFVEMLQEMKRIQDKLSKQISKNSQLSKQNEILRRQKMQTSIRLSDPVNVPNFQMQTRLQKQKQNLMNHFGMHIYKYGLIYADKIKELQQKLIKVQRNHSDICNLIQSRKKFQTPKRESLLIEPQTNTGSNEPDNQHGLSIGKLRRRSVVDSEAQIKQLNEKINLYHVELESSLKQNQKLKVQIEIMKQKNRQEGQSAKNKGFLKKISDLQDQLQNNHKQAMLRRLEDQENNFLKQKDSRALFSRYLQNYLQELNEIKDILNSQEVNRYVKTLEINMTEFYSLEEQLDLMKNANQHVINQLRQKILRQALQIQQLKKENSLLKTEVRLQHEQISKMRELVGVQVQRWQMGQQAQKSYTHINSARSHRTQFSHVDSQKYKNYISEAVRKIQILQKQISQTLQA